MGRTLRDPGSWQGGGGGGRDWGDVSDLIPLGERKGQIVGWGGGDQRTNLFLWLQETLFIFFKLAPKATESEEGASFPVLAQVGVLTWGPAAETGGGLVNQRPFRWGRAPPRRVVALGSPSLWA